MANITLVHVGEPGKDLGHDHGGDLLGHHTTVDSTQLLTDYHALLGLFNCLLFTFALDFGSRKLINLVLASQTLQIVVKLSALNVLENEEKLPWCVNHVIEPHYILMLELFEHVYFSDNAFLAACFHQIEFLIDFNS